MWLSENLLTHQNHHFLDGDLCVCEVSMHVYKYITEEDGVGKGGGGGSEGMYYTRPSYLFQSTAAWQLTSIQTTYTCVLATSATLLSRFHAVYILVVSTAMCTMANGSIMHLFMLMVVHIEFRVCLFYCTSHLCLLVIHSIISLHSSLVCALARSTSRSADVLIWVFIHLRSQVI